MAEVTKTINGGVSYGSATVTRCPRIAGHGSADLEDSPYASVEVAITTAQMLAIRATPVTLVAAPGTGKVLQFLGATLIYDFAAAYTESTDNLAVKYTNGSGVAVSETIETTGFLDATADRMIQSIPIKDALMTANAALVLHNTGDGEFGGSGSPVLVKILFAVHTTGL